MTYVVTDSCIRCKFMVCVEICPVEAFHEGANMLVINPDVCIDCGACVPECPADAIVPDIDREAAPWMEVNKRWSAVWPVISLRGETPADADAHRGEAGKYEKYFSAEPGRADKRGATGAEGASDRQPSYRPQGARAAQTAWRSAGRRAAFGIIQHQLE